MVALIIISMDEDEFKDSGYKKGTVSLSGFGLFLGLSFSF